MALAPSCGLLDIPVSAATSGGSVSSPVRPGDAPSQRVLAVFLQFSLFQVV